ncbi:hypothetical protein Tco_0201986, partial [Tanacetum coccineum]
YRHGQLVQRVAQGSDAEIAGGVIIGEIGRAGSANFYLERRDFPMNEPHPTYKYFAPAPLPEYAGNPNNNNGWLAVDDYLLGELEAMMFASADSIKSFLLAVQVTFLLIMFLLVMFSFLLTEIESADYVSAGYVLVPADRDRIC